MISLPPLFDYPYSLAIFALTLLVFAICLMVSKND